MNKNVRYYLGLLALSVLWDLLFTLPPIVAHFGINPELLYRFFAPVCHQMDSRSFHIFGMKLAVCSRCASIYYGVTLGMVVYPAFRSLQPRTIPRLAYLLVPLSILVADFAVNYTDVARNTFLSRTLTGGALGVSLAFFIVPVWLSLLNDFQYERRLQNEK